MKNLNLMTISTISILSSITFAVGSPNALTPVTMNLMTSSVSFATDYNIKVHFDTWIGSPHTLVEKLEQQLMDEAIKVCKKNNMTVNTMESIQMSFESTGPAQPVNFSGEAGGGYLNSYITLAMPVGTASASVNCLLQTNF